MSFAKAIASRLEWSFVEVFPSRLAATPGALAGALRDTFLTISELEHAVVFIDEVEEIASHRQGEPPSPTQGVTNELLKIIPAFREQPDRLLICATNFIRALDSAFLRHGRFDYVIPIGLPDEEARTAIWGRYIPAAAVDIDVSALVEMTDGFSPADIEYAARKASQSALENAVHSGEADARGPHMEDYIAAIAATRATVSPEVAAEFLRTSRRSGACNRRAASPVRSDSGRDGGAGTLPPAPPRPQRGQSRRATRTELGEHLPRDRSIGTSGLIAAANGCVSGSGTRLGFLES